MLLVRALLFNVVENKRVSGGRVLQRHVLYLGEINSSQELAWRRSIEVLGEATQGARTLALLPEDRCEGVVLDASIVRLKLAQLRLERPRQWGVCWLALRLWQQLGLDEFWGERLAPSRALCSCLLPPLRVTTAIRAGLERGFAHVPAGNFRALSTNRGMIPPVSRNSRSWGG
jgi:hypothetical protein